MSAPNHNNTTPAANPSTSSSVPKWGEAGFVAIEGARFGEDGFVPCGRPGHRGPRAAQQHTAEECLFGGSQRRATNRLPRRQTAHVALNRGRGHQINSSGHGRQDNRSGSGYGRQIDSRGYGRLRDLGSDPFGEMARGAAASAPSSSESYSQGIAAIAGLVNVFGQTQRTQLQSQQQQFESQMAQQNQPAHGLSHRGGRGGHRGRQGPSTDAQRNGVKKNKKRGADNHCQPKFRKDNNGPGGNGSASAGAGAGAPASV
jgi:hypothetical protein